MHFGTHSRRGRNHSRRFEQVSGFSIWTVRISITIRNAFIQSLQVVCTMYILVRIVIQGGESYFERSLPFKRFFSSGRPAYFLDRYTKELSVIKSALHIQQRNRVIMLIDHVFSASVSYDIASVGVLHCLLLQWHPCFLNGRYDRTSMAFHGMMGRTVTAVLVFLFIHCRVSSV